MVDQESSDGPRAWLIRAGRSGELGDFVIENSLACIGFGDIPDLTGVSTRDEMRETVRRSYSDASDGKVANVAGQIWALRSRVRPGDVVVMPLKKTSQIALGVVTGGYRYLDDPEAWWHHAVAVDWKRTDVPRTAVRQDLLYSLGALMTVCEIKRNDGAWRLRRILETGSDPGARVEAVEAIKAGDADATDSSESTFDLERLGRDQIQARVAEKFAGHGLSDLVAEVLEAEGFSTQVAPPGPDGGIDVFAGQGPLGLDSPRLIVQVKSSPAPVDVKVVRELHGVLSTHGADQALLVAWGGVNKTARQELRSQFFRVRVWDADNLLDAVLRNYDKLSEELRADLPLKRVWSLVDE